MSYDFDPWFITTNPPNFKKAIVTTLLKENCKYVQYNP